MIGDDSFLRELPKITPHIERNRETIIRILQDILKEAEEGTISQLVVIVENTKEEMKVTRLTEGYLSVLGMLQWALGYVQDGN